MSRSRSEQNSSNVPLAKIENSMDQTAAMREAYIQAAQAEQVGGELIKRWHSSVINYFVELRVYRHNDLIQKKWEQCRMWPDENGDWVTGMDTLIDWVNRPEQTTQQNIGRGSSTETTFRTGSLSPEKLMRVSMLLDEFAHDLGIRIDTARGRPTGEIEVEDSDNE